MDKPRKARDQADADRRSSPSGTVIYGAILKEGREELERPTAALFWSGIAAGLSMGGSLMAEGLLASRLPEADWEPLVSKFGYCLGFLIVILGRQQLFTENTLTPILPLLLEKTWSRAMGVLRLWGVVLGANLLGCLAAAWVASAGSAFDPDVREQFKEIGRQAMEGTFGAHVMRAILAGWLIALMIWLLPFAESARVWVIVILSYVIGLGHFSHVIAGSVQTFHMAIVGERTWLEVLGRYLLPTFIGNVIGGVALVAALTHAQVVSGSSDAGVGGGARG